jgi:osmoprotectant transport system ATP-binding protein
VRAAPRGLTSPDRRPGPGGRSTRGASVELRNVSKRYGGPVDQVAVDDLSLSVAPGEICVLVGPSGCGKTTTLKMVNRLVEPTSGTVVVDGRNVLEEEPTALRRSIGYVIQQVGLFPHQTVGQNVATVPRLLGWPAARITERVDELLVLVDLVPAQMRDRYPAQLSGGERQRVGVARALAAEPPLLLMDEPFGAVDPIVRERLQDDLLRILRQLGTTVILVTHDIDEAIKLGDRVAVLRAGGRLVQHAPPAELLARPADDFVARFVGADRGLKRLALVRVGEIALSDVTTALVGDPARDARSRASSAAGRYVLVLDRGERPLGWLNLETTPDDAVVRVDQPVAVVTAAQTLRDALSALLATGARTGAVVDERGVYIGALPLDTVAAVLAPPELAERSGHGSGTAPVVVAGGGGRR